MFLKKKRVLIQSQGKLEGNKKEKKKEKWTNFKKLAKVEKLDDDMFKSIMDDIDESLKTDECEKHKKLSMELDKKLKKGEKLVNKKSK